MTSICLRPARHAKHVRGAPCLATRIVSDQPSLRLAGIPEKTTKFTPPAHFGAGADRVASVKFVTPERVYLTGSVANGGCLRISPGTSSAVADVAVEVPKGYYAEKDYLDHRYHAKRFAYLQVLQPLCSRSEDCIRAVAHGEPPQRHATGTHVRHPTGIRQASDRHPTGIGKWELMLWA